MNQLTRALIGAAVRHLLTFAAGYGVMLSEDLVTQVIAGLVGIGATIWSAKQKKATVPAMP